MPLEGINKMLMWVYSISHPTSSLANKRIIWAYAPHAFSRSRDWGQAVLKQNLSHHSSPTLCEALEKLGGKGTLVTRQIWGLFLGKCFDSHSTRTNQGRYMRMFSLCQRNTIFQVQWNINCQLLSMTSQAQNSNICSTLLSLATITVFFFFRL